MKEEAKRFNISEERLKILIGFFETKLHDDYATSWGGLTDSLIDRFKEYAIEIQLEKDYKLLDEEVDFIYTHVGYVCDYCLRSYYLNEVEVITEAGQMYCVNCAENNEELNDE